MKIEDLLHFTWFKERVSEKALDNLRLIEHDSKWVPGKMGTILLDDEIHALGWVPCTLREAETILQRNNELLENVRPYHYTDIGCPHCNLNRRAPFSSRRHNTFDCTDCAWSVRSPRGTDTCPCFYQTFGGYNMLDSGVEYGLDHGKITLINKGIVDHYESVQPSAAAVFLGAHIEWALMCLYGELVFPDTSFRKWKRSKQAKWKSLARKSLKDKDKMKGETGV